MHRAAVLRKSAVRVYMIFQTDLFSILQLQKMVLIPKIIGCKL